MLAGDPSPVLLEWLLNLWLVPVPVPGPASVMASSTRACDVLLPRTGRTFGVTAVSQAQRRQAGCLIQIAVHLLRARRLEGRTGMRGQVRPFTTSNREGKAAVRDRSPALDEQVSGVARETCTGRGASHPVTSRSGGRLVALTRHCGILDRPAVVRLR